MKRWIVVALGVVLVAGVLVGFQRKLIYFPSQAVALLPAWVEEVQTTTSDGLELRGWVARRDRAQPLLLVFHGNGGTGADRLPLADALRPHGVAVLLTEYRGYGGNPGTPTEDGLTRDAAAWRSWADAHHDGPVAYLGESLGAAVATRLATTAPPVALVLRSPFTSLAEVGGAHYPLLPLQWLLSDRYEVDDRIAEVDAPVLVITGGADEIVPIDHSRRVYEAAGEPKRLVEVAEVGHNDLELLAGPQMVEAIVDLLDQTTS